MRKFIVIFSRKFQESLLLPNRLSGFRTSLVMEFTFQFFYSHWLCTALYVGQSSGQLLGECYALQYCVMFLYRSGLDLRHGPPAYESHMLPGMLSYNEHGKYCTSDFEFKLGQCVNDISL